MSTVTPYLGLVKPDGSENVNVNTQINQNYDRMDAKTLELSGRVTLVEEAFGIETEVWEDFTPSWRTGTTATVKYARIRRSGTVCQFQILAQPMSWADEAVGGLVPPSAPAAHYNQVTPAGFFHDFFPGNWRWAGGTAGLYVSTARGTGDGVLGWDSTDNIIYLHLPEVGGSVIGGTLGGASTVFIDCTYEIAPA